MGWVHNMGKSAGQTTWLLQQSVWTCVRGGERGLWIERCSQETPTELQDVDFKAMWGEQCRENNDVSDDSKRSLLLVLV